MTVAKYLECNQACVILLVTTFWLLPAMCAPSIAKHAYMKRPYQVKAAMN